MIDATDKELLLLAHACAKRCGGSKDEDLIPLVNRWREMLDAATEARRNYSDTLLRVEKAESECDALGEALKAISRDKRDILITAHADEIERLRTALRQGAVVTRADILELRPEVAAFAQAMERKLRENDHKGGWKDETRSYLFRGLDSEVDELRVATQTPRFPGVLDEAADVANFAMMIADVCGAL